jgi:drug/metabolite transporter (DMT)-like permease
MPSPNPISTAIVVASALLWAACDVVRKRALATHSLATVQRGCAVGQLVLSAAWLIRLGPALPTSNYWAYGIAGSLISAAGTYCFLMALARAPLSASIPLLGLTPAFTAIGAWLISHQTLSPLSIGGVVLVVLGSFVANPIIRDAAAGRQALMWMSGAALSWSAASSLDARAVHLASVPVHGSVSSALAIVATFVVPMKDRATSLDTTLADSAHPTSDSSAKWLWASATVCALAALTQWYAFSIADAGVIEATKRAIGTLAALAAGALVFRETLTHRRITGAAMLTAGTLILCFR